MVSAQLIQDKINTMIKKETHMEDTNRAAATSCLLEICGDTEARPADRVAAAKLLLELDRPEDTNTITVIMEGVEKEYCR